MLAAKEKDITFKVSYLSRHKPDLLTILVGRQAEQFAARFTNLRIDPPYFSRDDDVDWTIN